VAGEGTGTESSVTEVTPIKGEHYRPKILLISRGAKQVGV
jgi:hypothetical protein